LNREIKFRAWNKVEKKMYNNTGFVGLADYEFLQYTGLNDKNGTEIYEGDIVTCAYYGKIIRGEIHIGKCTQDVNGGEYSTWYHGVGFKFICPPEGIWDDDVEWLVEGNIYENPELL